MKPWAQSIIYQIYPRSFNDTNNDGVGDIHGIIEKLDYLENLGIDAIWISPIYPSPMKDFGYDVADYYNIDPLFGTLEDFDQLVFQAHKRNIKIMMDYVPNHSSDKHVWFKESRSARDNPKRDWYIWKDAKPDGSPPNNWQSVFGGAAWQWDERTQQYYLHTFLKEQPDLNWRDPEVQREMFDVLRFWMKRGVDGFRIDAFIFMYKDTRFLDEPLVPEKLRSENQYYNFDHIYTRNQPEILGWISDVCSVLKEKPGTFAITETSAKTTTLPLMIQWYEAGDSSVHAPFNFQLISLPWNASLFSSFITEYDQKVGPNYIPNYVLGNHDRPRVASRIGTDAARTAALLLLTLRGLPTIYYGDELGMSDTEIPEEQLIDPHKKIINGKVLNRDPARTPMQWNTAINSGFSSHTPWLPVNNDYQHINVETEETDPKSMLSLYKTLLRFRHTSQAIQKGIYRQVLLHNDSLLSYIREYNDEKILVILNFSNTTQNVEIPYTNAILHITTYLDREKQQIQGKSILLRPHEGLLFQIH